MYDCEYPRADEGCTDKVLRGVHIIGHRADDESRRHQPARHGQRVLNCGVQPQAFESIILQCAG
jgi:hypothetical protein